MKPDISIAFLISLIFLYGCGNKQIYEAIQENRQQKCQQLQHPHYEECMKKYEESYEDYKKAHEEAKEQ